MTAPTLRLSDLAGPDAADWSDVAVFVYPDTSEGDPFTIEERDGKLLIRTMNGRTSIAPYWAAHPVRRLGRGRLEPARIVMEGEADLAAQVATLREALQFESTRLSSSIHCGEMYESHGPSCSHYQCHAVHRIRKILAATAPTPIACPRCHGTRSIPVGDGITSADMMDCPSCTLTAAPTDPPPP